MHIKSVGNDYKNQSDEYGSDGAPGQMVMSDGGPDRFGNQITIEQLFRGADASEICGCEAKNRYKISGAPQPLFISESSDCPERVCCGPQRSLTFNLHDGPNEEGLIIYKFEKSFHCQAACCDSLRPKLDIIDARTSVFMGRAFDPFKCCTIDNQLFDGNNNLVYTTKGPLIQFGVCCPCGNAEFPVVEANASGMAPASSGSITKVFNGLSEICLQANKFRIDFPRNAPPNRKPLLLGSALLLDIQYFEKQK